jgi:NCAIR mutase (PurE)-related protein
MFEPVYSRRGELMSNRTLHLQDLARLDIDRQSRAGIPEAVLAEGKSLDQVIVISQRMAETAGRALVTRLAPGQGDALRSKLGGPLTVELYAEGRLAIVRQPDAVVKPTGGAIGVLAAGTADIPVAEEARVTAEEMGCETIKHYDIGVAGIHRLVEPLQDLQQRDVAAVVVVAGMEGALPTVVKGLLAVPVVGVPTSVGYGVSRNGEAALMAMLNSCSPGLTVVNIDNGFGAGATAALIANRLAAAKAAANSKRMEST